MVAKNRILTTVALALSGVVVAIAGITANVLRGGIGISALIAFVAAVVASALTWTLSRNSPDVATNEEDAFRRLRLLISAAQSRLNLLSDDIDFSIELQRDGKEVVGRETTVSAFIASLAADPRCTVITGAPGSGKSALMAQLAAHMMDARVTGESRYTPLLLPCRSWTSESRLSSWVIKETTDTYGIAHEVTRRWLNRGSAILLLDGLDEISDDARHTFVPQFNIWLKSGVGGRAILSCRTDSYVRYFGDISHEQLANLEPLRSTQIWQYVSRIFDQQVPGDRIRFDAKSLLDHVISTDIEKSSILLTPLVIRLLADAPAITRVSETSDPAAVALRLGDTLRNQGDEVGAIESYLLAAGSTSSPWRSIAAMRASLLLARSGDYERAREALQTTLANEISQSIRDPLASLSEDLSDDERAVLEALSADKTLDAFQVSSLSSVSPSRCNSALRSLRDRSLIEVADTQEGEPRFRRVSPFESVKR